MSLDSSREETHDAFRGVEGSWRRTVEFISALASGSGVFPQVIMSMASPDRQALAEMVGFLTGKPVSGLKINLISPVGKAKDLYFGKPGEFEECLGFLDWACSEYPNGVTPDAPPAFMPVNRLKGAGSCWILNLLGVLPDGTLSFCGIAYSKPELSMGVYPQNSLEEVWRGAPLLAELRNSMSRGPQGICSRCIHWRMCLGKCVMENYAVGGSFSAPHRFCETAFNMGLFPAARLHD